MTPEEQVAEIKSRSTPYANTTTRKVVGGFFVTGQVQWKDNATGGIVMAENAEGIAADENGAATMVLNYLKYSTFDAPSQPAMV